MDKNKTYGVVAAVIVIIIIAVAAWYVTSNDDNGSDTPTDEGDTYYFYLDGMDDFNGWYAGKGINPGEGLVDALADAELPVTYSSNGFILTIGDYQDGLEGNYFGYYGYENSDVSEKASYCWFAGPPISEMNCNIIYICYSGFDENYNMILNPNTTEADVMGTGPFTGEYTPIAYDGTFYVYLDGMGDLNGWYTGTGDNPQDGLTNALASEGVTVTYASNGFIRTIGDYQDGLEGMYFGYYGYETTIISPDNGYCWFSGPVIKNMTCNIIYICYSGFNEDYEMNLTPTTTEADVMGTGPFATA